MKAPVFWVKNWFERHQLPASRYLHYVGIPLTLLAVVLAGVQLAHGQWGLWWRPVSVLILGYALQLVGHILEGNDMGEMILFKRMLGRPYRAVSPRFARGGGSIGGEMGQKPPLLPRNSTDARTVDTKAARHAPPS